MRRNAEDLIIHKAIAGRPQDVRDVEGVAHPRLVLYLIPVGHPRAG
ncbi:MAG: hypothetical protein ACUVR4_06860 [Anaerolineae bacterium]